MARILLNLATQLMTISFLSSFSLILVTSEDRSYVRIVDKKELGLKKQKISHFRVYWHDILSGSNPTAVRIVPPPSNSSATSFGFLAMIDDPLTEGPNLTSKMVGRAQGLYGSAAQEELRLILAMNFVFTEGKFNGSSITILGSNKVSLNIREMPVIGGTGIFRLTRDMFRQVLIISTGVLEIPRWSTISMFCIIETEDVKIRLTRPSPI